jgi:hypothetical protein
MTINVRCTFTSVGDTRGTLQLALSKPNKIGDNTNFNMKCSIILVWCSPSEARLSLYTNSHRAEESSYKQIKCCDGVVVVLCLIENNGSGEIIKEGLCNEIWSIVKCHSRKWVRIDKCPFQTRLPYDYKFRYFEGFAWPECWDGFCWWWCLWGWKVWRAFDSISSTRSVGCMRCL